MKTRYDQIEDAFYLRFADETVVESDEIRPGVILDFDANGRIVAIEILDASTRVAGDVAAQSLTAA